MKRFLEAVSGDKEFAEKLAKAETPESVIAIAAENGFTLTAEDLEPSKVTDGEISDAEMDAVAGGKDCYCFLGGGGTGSSTQKTCACVADGFGFMECDDMRCACFGFGIGGDGKFTPPRIV